jgi:hypothetical protein
MKIGHQRIDDKIWNYQVLLQQYQIKSNGLNSKTEMAMGYDFLDLIKLGQK